MKLSDFLDSTHLRMPFATKWVGRTGIVLGPILGLLHLLAAAVMRPYGQHVVEQYDAVQSMGNLLAAPAASISSCSVFHCVCSGLVCGLPGLVWPFVAG